MASSGLHKRQLDALAGADDALPLGRSEGSDDFAGLDFAATHKRLRAGESLKEHEPHSPLSAAAAAPAHERELMRRTLLELDGERLSPTLSDAERATDLASRVSARGCPLASLLPACLASACAPRALF